MIGSVVMAMPLVIAVVLSVLALAQTDPAQAGSGGRRRRF